MSIVDQTTGTTIDEIVASIYRISTPLTDIVPGGFTFNQYLVVDTHPLLFHTGPAKMFPSIQKAVAKIIPVNTLRYISFSHFEADECGSLNDWLKAAPDAVPVCSRVAAMTSIADIAIRSPKAMADGEILSLGEHQVQWHDTPHLPHGWDCGYLFESKTRTLFCGDLFTQPGSDHEPLTVSDILETSEMMRSKMDYFAHGKKQRNLFEKLAATQPKILACMHGSAWQGDGARLLLKLADRICGLPAEKTIASAKIPAEA